MKSFLLVCIAIALAGCSAAPRPAVVDTATPVPLKEIDLPSLVLETQNLPEGITFGEEASLPNMFIDIPPSENYFYRPFKRGPRAAGGVGLFVFNSSELASQVFSLMKSDFGTESKSIPEIGEQSEGIVVSQKLTQSTLQFVDLVFQRCGAVGYIRLAGVGDIEAALPYAKELDNRVSQAVCR